MQKFVCIRNSGLLAAMFAAASMGAQACRPGTSCYNDIHPADRGNTGFVAAGNDGSDRARQSFDRVITITSEDIVTMSRGPAIDTVAAPGTGDFNNFAVSPDDADHSAGWLL